MSRWSRWYNREDKPGFKSFMETLGDQGNPSAAAGGPAERAKQLGLQSNGKGGYIDPNTGELAARTVNGELVFYDNNSPNGGAVSDGAGGRNLVQQQPSWADPLTGMMTTPPANPESPQEIAAIPDPTPATPPAGYNSFMQQKKQDAYQQNKEQPQPARLTPDEAEEQEQQAQAGDPGEQNAFAANDAMGEGVNFKMFKEGGLPDAAKKMAAAYTSNNQKQEKEITKDYDKRSKAVEKRGTTPEDLIARLGKAKPKTMGHYLNKMRGMT